MFGTARTSDFNSVVKQYYPAIVFFAEKIIDNHAIAQDVFVKLWEQEHSFDNDTNIRNFLYLSARNRCLNYIRDTKRKQQREVAIPLSSIPEDEITNNIILAEVWREIELASLVILTEVLARQEKYEEAVRWLSDKMGYCSEKNRSGLMILKGDMLTKMACYTAALDVYTAVLKVRAGGKAVEQKMKQA